MTIKCRYIHSCSAPPSVRSPRLVLRSDSSGRQGGIQKMVPPHRPSRLVLLFTLFSRVSGRIPDGNPRLAGFAWIVSPEAAFSMTAKDIFSIFSSYNRPWFRSSSSWADRLSFRDQPQLFDTAYAWIGHLRAGSPSPRSARAPASPPSAARPTPRPRPWQR